MYFKEFVESNNLQWVDSGEDVPFNELLGKTPIKVEKVDEEKLYFEFEDCIYLMHHWVDCCEAVEIEDICGDLRDLVGYPILLAEESTNREDNPKDKEWEESFTWTFYKLATVKGYVDIRWYGASNGSYSEEVSLTKCKKLGLKH